MKKTLLIIQREYRNRIRKPSFWITTVLVPLFVAALYTLPVLIASRPAEHAHVLVADDTGLFISQFHSTRDITYLNGGSLDYAKRLLAERDSIDAIVYIPAPETSIPHDAFLYYRTDVPSATVQGNVESQLTHILHNRILLDVHGITPEDYNMIKGTQIKLRPVDLETGRDGFLHVKIALGLLLALLVFLAVFMFGSQVMRGIMEEKANRIVEILVCSAKPFQLMAGKVLGIGMAGLTQFLLWVVLSGAALGCIRTANADLFLHAEQKQTMNEIATKGVAAADQLSAAEAADPISELIQGLTAINYAYVVVMFLLFFLVGYLLYASIFAAIGSLIDPETDSQQFALPVAAPLLLALALAPFTLNAPSGALSTWLSIIPLTSPVAMMIRIPFGVPIWQMVLSLALLTASVPACTWLAAKIYHQRILQFGKIRTRKH